jgi:hypothetical protein
MFLALSWKVPKSSTSVMIWPAISPAFGFLKLITRSLLLTLSAVSWL